jgi:hypothetical protein
MQYIVCSSPGCRGKATLLQKYGRYYRIGFTGKGKSSTKVVRIDLAMELSNLRITQNRT